MKHSSHYSLAALIPMAIWGGMLPAQAADGTTPDDTKKSETTAVNDDETMVVTAAAQTLQAPEYPPSPPKKSVNIRPRAMSPS